MQARHSLHIIEEAETSKESSIVGHSGLTMKNGRQPDLVGRSVRSTT